MHVLNRGIEILGPKDPLSLQGWDCLRFPCLAMTSPLHTPSSSPQSLNTLRTLASPELRVICQTYYVLIHITLGVLMFNKDRSTWGNGGASYHWSQVIVEDGILVYISVLALFPPFRDRWSVPMIVKAIVTLPMGLPLHYIILVFLILEYCNILVFFKLNVQMNHLGMLLKCRLLIEYIWVGAWILHFFYKLPGNAHSIGLWTTE